MLKKMMITSTALFLLLASNVFAQSSIAFHPYKTEIAPKIDGILDDAAWENSNSERGFKTWYPDYGKDMDDTIVFYAYDESNLYFAFRAFDSEPDKIKASISARDKTHSDDWICINLDTYNDQQSLYAFYVNPMGIQSDSRYASGKEDISADFVWYTAGRIDEKGYIIEVKIPFKSIRFSNLSPVTMGVVFERRISRASIMGTLPELDPAQGGNFLTQTRPLIYPDIKSTRLFEILPAVTYGATKSINESTGDLSETSSEGDVSLTAKLGITSNLILDGTVNPDFSQVEADAGQIDVNLRFPIAYAEKRPFFLEGRDDFNPAGNAMSNPLVAVVHTRNIANPNAGIKMTGKMGDKNSISSIFAVDDLGSDALEGDNAQFGIVRYKRALNQDNFVGAYYTGREVDNGFNRVTGADGQFRLNKSSAVGVIGLASTNKEYNSEDTDNGHFVSADYNYGTRNLSITAQAFDISENFRTKTGFINRTGYTRGLAIFTPRFYPKNKNIRRIDLTGLFAYLNDKSYDDGELYHAYMARLLLPMNFSYMIRYNFAEEIFLGPKFDRNSFQTSLSSQLSKKFSFSMSYTNNKRVRYIANPYQGYGNSVAASFTYQPTGNLQSIFNYNYSSFYNSSSKEKEYDYYIVRSKNTFQFNKYLFFRGIVEYNTIRDDLNTDFLASFTYVPGTVVHLGYGSMYQKQEWQNGELRNSDSYMEVQRGFFFKTSYLWRF